MLPDCCLLTDYMQGWSCSRAPPGQFCSSRTRRWSQVRSHSTPIGTLLLPCSCCLSPECPQMEANPARLYCIEPV
ncbi:hypothetical protein N656DRAFT_81702 [Canariomyces notabilis]|uniref:Uncharacterized protein n=1 Tax=Canariomyces notabilis TaxID=2074819 RepID=A0AAN6TEG3_9PEZI|nr:hypothetical protein N656DRAFT_81702 [Canariomyces arenarius]